MTPEVHADLVRRAQSEQRTFGTVTPDVVLCLQLAEELRAAEMRAKGLEEDLARARMVNEQAEKVRDENDRLRYEILQLKGTP